MENALEVQQGSEADPGLRMLSPVRLPVSNAIEPFAATIGRVRPAPEWYREMTIKLQTLHAPGSIKTIAFTSTGSGSGTTSIASGFAVCLSHEFDHRVLLIDANPRQPGIHTFFSHDHTCLLSKVLENGCDTPGAHDGTSDRALNGNLMVITCSEDRAGATALFITKRFSEFLKSVREQFDYVILDTAPIIHFSESRIISAQTDGTILVLESGKTRRQVALKAKREIEAGGGAMLGVVLNRRNYIIPKWLYRLL